MSEPKQEFTVHVSWSEKDKCYRAKSPDIHVSSSTFGVHPDEALKGFASMIESVRCPATMTPAQARVFMAEVFSCSPGLPFITALVDEHNFFVGRLLRIYPEKEPQYVRITHHDGHNCYFEELD
jgi:hypothetical protein